MYSFLDHMLISRLFFVVTDGSGLGIIFHIMAVKRKQKEK